MFQSLTESCAPDWMGCKDSHFKMGGQTFFDDNIHFLE